MSDRPAATPFSAVLEASIARREFLKGGLAAAVAAALPLVGCAGTPEARPVAIGFTGIPPSPDDALKIAPEYDAIVLYRWGDPVGIPGNMPAFRMDASNTAAEQEAQAGMHHDGMYFYPLPYASGASAHGLLAMNHEYLDDGLLHPDGRRTWSAEKVRKAQASVGVSVIEVRLQDARWEVVRPSATRAASPRTRPARSRARPPGPTAMKTAFDPGGREVLGTYNGCANGYTPWGTYLTCEENWNFFFVTTRRDFARAAALRHRQGPRLQLGGARRALRRREASERAEPLRLGGGDRPVRAAVEAGEAHRARADQARRRAPVGRAGRADRVLHGRRRGVRVHLQVRDRARVGSGEPRGEPRSPRRRRPLRRAVQRRRHR